MNREPRSSVEGTFVAGQTHPFVDYQAFLGGTVRILSNIAANAATTIAHLLNRKPLGMFVLYAHGVYAPKWQDTAAWDTKNVYVEFDTAIPASPSYIVVWII